MRPVDRGNAPTDQDGNAIVFQEYRDARDHLIRRLGDYCSYCEVALHSDVDVEHVRPKSKHSHLAKTWTNFLLACKYCNPTKGDKDVVLNDYYWPDTDNTARPFIYELDRAPQVAGSLNAGQKTIARRTLELTGVDREPPHAALTPSDRRWLKRRAAWGVAIGERQKIRRNDTAEQRESALHVAIGRGFWSVWMQVFSDDLDMRRSLIAWFFGTDITCFDNQTQPVARAGGNI